MPRASTSGATQIRRRRHFVVSVGSEYPTDRRPRPLDAQSAHASEIDVRHRVTDVERMTVVTVEWRPERRNRMTPPSSLAGMHNGITVSSPTLCGSPTASVRDRGQDRRFGARRAQTSRNPHDRLALVNGAPSKHVTVRRWQTQDRREEPASMTVLGALSVVAASDRSRPAVARSLDWPVPAKLARTCSLSSPANRTHSAPRSPVHHDSAPGER